MAHSSSHSDDGLQRLLPLSRSLLYLLLALQEGSTHGYAVKKRAAELSGGVVKLGPGTLYTTIQKAANAGLVQECEARPPEEEDQSQRRYYEITDLGRQALSAEVDRMGRFVDEARAALSGAHAK